MNKLILSTLALMMIAAGFGSAAAQKNTKPPPKMRDITIYVYQRPAPDSGDFYGKIVPFRRTVIDRNPLSQAFELLLKGVNEAEQKKHGVDNFIFGLKFIAARVRNNTAQINFKFTDEDIAEESWEGGGFDRENFAKAVELTARQFPGVERVSFCISGYKEYKFFGSSKADKCPFPMFSRASSSSPSKK